MESGSETGYSNLSRVQSTIEDSEPEDEQIQVESMPTATLQRILIWRRYLILVLTPILLMPIPIAVSGTVSCCFVVLFAKSH